MKVYPRVTTTRRELLAGSALLFGSRLLRAREIPPPQPYGALPSPRQLRWQRMESYSFLGQSPRPQPDTYWATDDSVTAPTLIINFPRPAKFNLIRLREAIQLGQRIEAFASDT